jgi:hypothetical protein
MEKVFLPPVTAAYYKDSNLDPQQQISKDPHRSLLLLQSEDCTLQLDKTNIVYSTVRQLGDTQEVLATNISRFKISSVSIAYDSPNVNPYNNTVTFFSTFSLTEHTVNILPGFYATPTELMNQLIFQLNSVGASGLTFSYVDLGANKFGLSSSGGMYFFNLDSSMVKFGSQLIGLPTDQIATNSKVVGTVNLFYTKYIDICSSTISEYEKIRTTSTNLNYNIVLRLYLDSGNAPQYINYYTVPDVSYNYLDAKPIYSLNFELRDQFGNLLYIQFPDYGFSWGISLIIEY